MLLWAARAHILLRIMVSTRSRSSASVKAAATAVAQTEARSSQDASPTRLALSVKAELLQEGAHASPEILEKAAAEALSADRPASEAKQIKRKVKAITNQPSIAAKDIPQLQAKAERIYKQLMELFEDPPCPLDHQSSFQLLVSVILSAQTTDKKVNEVTPELFRLAPDAESMSKLEAGTIEGIIRYVGLAPTKAKNLSKMSKMLVERHRGEVPQTFDELELLPGVGHKTASVVMAVAFKLPTFPVDTHIHRLAQRWGLTDGKSVEQTEVDLKLLWPEDRWNPLHLRLIYMGRSHCPAVAHDPTVCPICTWAAVPPYNRAGASPAKAGQPQSVRQRRRDNDKPPAKRSRQTAGKDPNQQSQQS